MSTARGEGQLHETVAVSNAAWEKIKVIAINDLEARLTALDEVDQIAA